MKRTLLVPAFLLTSIACDPPDDLGVVALREHPQPVEGKPCARLLHVEARVPSTLGADRLFVVSALDCAEVQEDLKLSVGPGPYLNGQLSTNVALPDIAAGGCSEVGGFHWENLLPDYHPICPIDGDWPSFHVALRDPQGDVIDLLEVPGPAPRESMTEGYSGKWYVGLPYEGCQYTKDAP